MKTENFNKEFKDYFKENTFGITNSGRAQDKDGKYILDKLFHISDINPDITLKDFVEDTIVAAQVLNENLGFVFATKVHEIGCILRIYADNYEKK